MTDTSVIPASSALYRRLETIAASQRIAIFAGLPGVGKSFLLQQLAIFARRAGRRVHLFQWDVVRGAFETPAMLARYPEVDGFTHAMIKKAVGLWIRDAILDWHYQYASHEHLLIGECALVGDRLMELVQPAPDPCEPLLAGNDTLFLLPVPSRPVRDGIEQRRQQTMAAPRHTREAADAPPNVVRHHWAQVYDEAAQLGLTSGVGSALVVPYQPDVYEAVYRHWLRHRRTETLHLDELFPVIRSVYEVHAVESELRATDIEVERIAARLDTSDA